MGLDSKLNCYSIPGGRRKHTNGQTVFFYHHHDHLGTPIQASADKPTITSNLRLRGQYEDTETGLHYNWHRHYDPQTGRYAWT